MKTKILIVLLLLTVLFTCGCNRQEVSYTCYDAREPETVITINTFVGTQTENNILTECQQRTSKVVIQKVMK